MAALLLAEERPAQGEVGGVPERPGQVDDGAGCGGEKDPADPAPTGDETLIIDPVVTAGA